MSAVLIAVILALVLGHAAPQLAQLRQYGWFIAWLHAVSARLGNNGWLGRGGAILVSLGLPLLLVGLVQALLDDRIYGLPGFAFAVLVLFYCWGPRDLESDVDAVMDAPDAVQRRAAATHLLAPRPVTLESRVLVESVFYRALERWFGVLLWFLLLGPVGAVGYRLAHLGAAQREDETITPEHTDAYRRLMLILDWPAAQLMTLGLALAANFDAVLGAWRDWHEERGQGWFVLDTGFLGAVARASVNCELAEENDDDFDVDADTDTLAAVPVSSALSDAMSLAWRVLLIWLAVLALFVLAGYVN